MKKFAKLTLVLALALGLALAFTACGGDDRTERFYCGGDDAADRADGKSGACRGL